MSGTPPERPLDRAESELLRVVLVNSSDLGDVAASDFTDSRLSEAFTAVAGLLASTPEGTELDISKVADPGSQSILRSLSMEVRPIPDVAEVKVRLLERRLDSRIGQLEEKLATLTSGTDAHSETLRRLIALQQEKRSLGGS